MLVSRLEKSLGIEVYATRSLGIGGVIKRFPEDFLVEEILVDGTRAEIHPKTITQIEESPIQRYLLCVLVKRSWDNLQAIRVIARNLGIKTRQISIAGIKDANAVTAQHITVESVTKEDLQKIHVKDLEIHPIRYFNVKLSPHYLRGNHFKITIRAINYSEKVTRNRISRIIKEIQALGGVPNFFGHQRFGTTRPITHLVGKALVKGDFHRAVMLFLAKPSPNEHPQSRKVREELWKTQDFKSALKSFPKSLHYERLVLRHLVKRPKDYIGALKRLPTKLQVLFPQAYQAYLFNKILSRRMSQGLLINKAEIGDYVIEVEPSGNPNTLKYKMVSSENISEINKAIANGRMALAVPLAGFRQTLSQGIQGEIERTVLEEEGISLQDFKIKKLPEISLKGELRAALARIKDFMLHEISKDETSHHKNRAVMSFMLYRGSYATIVLREIMKPRNLVKAGF
ncbi:MAG: tRNA pseudouridine(13) synthase TruD [Candidatus Bathyarchaeia archaeon]